MTTPSPPPAARPADCPTSTPVALAEFSVAARLNRLPITSLHRRATAVIGLGLFFDLYEAFLAGVLSTALVKDFHVTTGQLPWLLGSAFLGAFAGAVLLPTLADRVGRRRAFMLTLALYSVASLAGAFSPDLWWLVAARFVAGIGIGAELPVADTYLADLLPQRQRGRYIAWAYTLAFCGVPVVGLLGRFLVPHPQLGIEGWRWLLALGSLGAAVVWLLRRNLPESPRWLEAVGRHEEANRITAAMEQQATAQGPLDPPQLDVDPPGAQPLSALLQPPLRSRSIMLWIFQALQSFGYYGFGTLVPLVLAAKGYSVVTSLGYTATAFFGYPLGSLLSIPLIERVERKWLITASAGAMALLGLGFAEAARPWQIVACGLAYTMVSNVFSNGFHIYQTELFPTQLRATATGSAYSLSRLSTAVMPFIMVPLLHRGGPGWVFAVAAVAMATVAGTVAALGPRTNAQALEHSGAAVPPTDRRPRGQEDAPALQDTTVR
ncbi:MFS transporter [Streptacidiphilus sp. N1-12]|uniref:MFS transporter n=2 Tax=Streptacidiphilus alkalitolerans TaxID=3342712 RepID=A0ABV6VB04_9ACTN